MKKRMILFLCIIIGIASQAGLVLKIDPIAPVFKLDQKEYSKSISVYNASNETVTCEPIIVDELKFVKPGTFIGNNIFINPSKFQLEPGKIGHFNLYLYDTEKLHGSGEFSGILRVNTKNVMDMAHKKGMNFELEQQGVVQVMKSPIIQKITVSKFKVISRKGAMYITSTINNQSNIHKKVRFDVTYLDKNHQKIAEEKFVYIPMRESKESVEILVNNMKNRDYMGIKTYYFDYFTQKMVLKAQEEIKL